MADAYIFFRNPPFVFHGRKDRVCRVRKHSFVTFVFLYLGPVPILESCGWVMDGLLQSMDG